MSKDESKDENVNGEAPAETPSPKKRQPRSKETAGSASVQLNERTRAKLLNLNAVHSKAARVSLPLSASLLYAIDIAHETVFGKEFNESPGDVDLD